MNTRCIQYYKAFGKKLTVLGLLGMMLLGMIAGLMPPARAAEANKALTITMKHMGSEDGYTLKTVRTERQYHFTRPKGWKILPSSHVHLTFQHSPQLLVERSSLNVLVNNRILKTIPLGKDNITPTTLNIAIPPELLKDNNILSFQVDQHYTYDCEDPFSAELWTTVLPDTFMRLDYQPQPIVANLAHLPYPLFDPLNAYEPTRIGFVAPTTLSDGSLEALGIAVAYMGQKAQWRPYEAYLADAGSLGAPEDLIVVGTPDENPAIFRLGSSFQVPLSGGRFVGANGSALPDDYGVIQMVPNPGSPSHVVLVVSGNSPEGVKKAARALAQQPTNKLLVGRSAVIKEVNSGPDYPARAWSGFIQYSGDTLARLGLDTQTVRGITALPIFYNVKLMPDIHMPGNKKGKLKTVYSYSSQLDAAQSKLEILMNGKALKSVALNQAAGESLAEFDVEIPTEDLHTYNDLEYRFHVYPDKYGACKFVTDEHIWGTVHNTSRVEFPGEIKAALPDVGLVNDGGFPFTAYQDLSQMAVVLPDSPTNQDLSTMIQFLTRIGRVSESKRGILLTAHHAGTLADDAKKNRHLVAIGLKSRNKLFDELKTKMSLLTGPEWAELKRDNAKLAEVNYTGNQGIIEEILSPWNKDRVILLLTGESDTALMRTAQTFSTDKWFAAIAPGNLAVVNDDGPKSLILMQQGEAKFFYPDNLRPGFQMPTWGWIVIGIFAVLGLLSLLRFLFGR